MESNNGPLTESDQNRISGMCPIAKRFGLGLRIGSVQATGNSQETQVVLTQVNGDKYSIKIVDGEIVTEKVEE